MEYAVSIDRSATLARWNGKLESLKTRNVSTSDNRQLLGDRDLNKFMDPELYEATKTGDADKFIDALESVSELRRLVLSLIFDQATPSRNSLLHVAASLGKEDVIQLILIHFPYLVTRKNSSGDTPLHVAVQDGRLEVTRRLISLRRDTEIIYWKNKDSKSPLYLAAEEASRLVAHQQTSWGILRLLLETSARDEDYAAKIQGMSPVLAALEEGKSDILEEIIVRLPKLLRVLDEDGGTPLQSAASVGKLTKTGQWSSAASVGAVELLLRKCRYLALQPDKNGSYPIHIACEVCNVDIICKLAKMWPDLAEIKNKKGQNILHVAAKGGNNNAVRYILKECSELADFDKLVNSKDVDGNTPFHLASMHNHCEVMLYLLMDKRTKLQLWNNDGFTARGMPWKSESLSTKYPALLGRAIMRIANVPKAVGRDLQSPREQGKRKKDTGSNKRKRRMDTGHRKRNKWMEDKVNTRLIVATLVATVTFTVGFTLPGGYNASGDPRPGVATMLYNGVFQVFIISNMLAMYGSINAIVVLLWGHITNFPIAERAYFFSGPILLASLTSMSVAFMAASIVAVSNLTWLALLVLSIAVVCLVTLTCVLAALIFPRFNSMALWLGCLYCLVENLWTLPGDAVAVVRQFIYRRLRDIFKY